MVTTAGSFALKCDVHCKYVHVRVSVTMFPFIDIYCFSHTCNVCADKVELKLTFCRTRNHAQSMEVKLHLVYSSVTYLFLLTNILPSRLLTFVLKYKLILDMIICFTVRQIWTEWSVKSQTSKPPVEGPQDTENVQSCHLKLFLFLKTEAETNKQRLYSDLANKSN